jgi:hypothetical protein
MARRAVLWLVTCAAMAAVCGCAQGSSHGAKSEPLFATRMANDAGADSDTLRKMVWTGRLRIEVASVAEAATRAADLAAQSGGYVETQTVEKERRANLRLRVPAAGFKDAIASLEALGRVKERSVHAQDVTEQYVDLEARLKNRTALRDRLKQLLDKAADVKDVVAIETELNRVQADLDSMEGRMKALKGQVDLAAIDLTLERRPIYGPLGYFFKGLWWGIEKLFVIRE